MLGEPPSRIQMPGTFFVEKLQTPDGGEDFLLIYQEFYWSIDTPTNKIKLKGTSCEAVEIQIFDKKRLYSYYLP